MDDSLLGNYHWNSVRFTSDHAFDQTQPLHTRLFEVNKKLLELIQNQPPRSFLLPAVLQFIHEVNEKNLLAEKYSLTLFEFWLNHFSNLSEEENYQVRAKIMGKYIPREEYQHFFPIGMGKRYEGTHFVAAHLSPDIDTTIASFWGWIDAFAARVGNRLHIWALPEGPPESPTTLLMQQIFGPNIFRYLARTTRSISLKAIDLVTQEHLVKLIGRTSTNEIDHGGGEKAVILVDEEGYYHGNWRSSDVEVVRQVTILYKACLHNFQHTFHQRLIHLLAHNALTQSELDSLFEMPFALKGESSDKLDLFLKHVMKLHEGINTPFIELPSMRDLKRAIQPIDTAAIFPWLEKVIQQLDLAITKLRQEVEELQIAMKIKRQVLGHQSRFVNLNSDLEEIRLKMKHYDYLPVVITHENHHFFPIGVIWAAKLNQPVLGTVAFRDFCNLDEVNMSSYLSIISVIDHHKTSLHTTSTPLALVGDTQSSNVLIAEKAFLINDRYSLGGLKEIDKELKEAKSPFLMQRLLQRKEALLRQDQFFIHPDREYAEYLCFLHAILDDTDLLGKVTKRDVECAASLLNRLQSLIEGKEVEAVTLEGIPLDENFAKNSAKRILQNPAMYSFYAKTYAIKEKDIQKELETGDIFRDTKEQNGCCRVGQTKLFALNYTTFKARAPELRAQWLEKAKLAYQQNPALDLHIHMISTIASAKEVFEGTAAQYEHRDEFWFWIPPTAQGQAHLGSFLSGFQMAKEVMQQEMTLEAGRDLLQTFSQNFKPVTHQRREGDQSIAILTFKAGSINSRKSMVSPYLPQLVT